MSYILNALRKSEQSRRAEQAPAQENSFLPSPAPVASNKWRMIMSILLVNVIIIIGLFLFLRHHEQAQVSKPPEQAELAVEPPVQVAETVAPASKIIAQTKTDAALTKLKLQAEPESISSAIQARRKQQLQQKQKLAKVQPAKTKAPTNNPKVDTESVITEQDALDHVPSENTAQATVAVLPKAQPRIVKPAPKPRQVAAVPMLSELPYSFRREVPELDINVYVYSEQADERFIMVDMVRYVAGETIEGDVLLKEIQQNSLLVNYAGRTFKIARP